MKRKTYVRLGLLCLSLLVAAVLVGCSGGATTGGTTTTPPSSTSGGTTGGSGATTGGGTTTPPSGSTGGATGGATITEQNKAFTPASVVVKVGDTVTFANKDTVPHNVKINGKELGVQQPGESKTWTAPENGSYPFSCVIHPSISGKITVTVVVPTRGTGPGSARRGLAHA